jgi:hypothetical protein
LSHQRSNQDQRHESNQPQDRQAPLQLRTPTPVGLADVAAPTKPSSTTAMTHDRRLNVIV